MPIEITFDKEFHICRDMSGRWVPTVSQVLSLANLSFPFRRRVPWDVLDRRSAIGSDVHDLTDTHDADGCVPETWLTSETGGYLESYIQLCRVAKFKPVRWSTRRTELINGLPLSGESDKEGLFNGKHEGIVDLKTGSVKSDGWGFQLAPYEMLKYRSSRIGRIIRAVAWLKPDGSCGEMLEYGETSPLDGVHFGDTFLAGLHAVHAGIRRGYITERDVIEE